MFVRATRKKETGPAKFGVNQPAGSLRPDEKRLSVWCTMTSTKLTKALTTLAHIGLAATLIVLQKRSMGTSIIAASLTGLHNGMLLGVVGPRQGQLRWWWVPDPAHEPSGVLLFLIVGIAEFLAVGVVGYEPAFRDAYGERSVVDRLWLCFVLITTVGYGHSYTPPTPIDRCFTMVWALYGLFIFGASSGVLVEAVGTLLRNLKKAGKAGKKRAQGAIRRLRSRDQVDASRVAVAKWRPPDIYYVGRGLYFNYVAFVVLNFAGDISVTLLLCPSPATASPQPRCYSTFVYARAAGAGIFAVLEDWDFADGLYHCIMTATTIGLGDIAPTSYGGRLYGIIQMVLSAILFGSLLSTVVDGLKRCVRDMVGVERPPCRLLPIRCSRCRARTNADPADALCASMLAREKAGRDSQLEGRRCYAGGSRRRRRRSSSR